MERYRNPHTGKMEPMSHSLTIAAVRAPKRKPAEADAPPLDDGPRSKGESVTGAT